METKFEQRLREILTEYPEIDPARATLPLKDQPEATNEQIAQLSRFRPGEAGRGAPKPSKTILPPLDGKVLARQLAELHLQKDPNCLAARAYLAEHDRKPSSA
jgi:hypothetical protein